MRIRIAAPALTLALHLSATTESHATVGSFAIDSAASEVTLGGDVTFEFAGESVQLPFTAPGDGATLPSGTESDGLQTFFQGTLTAEITSDSIRFHLGDGDVQVGVNGSWTPGVPGDTGSPADGNVALDFADATYGILGSAVGRDVRFRISSLAIPLVETGPGSGVFNFDAAAFVTLFGGAVDIQTNIPEPFRRVTLGGPPFPNMAPTGTVERLAGDQVRITLPLAAIAMFSVEDALDAPMHLDLHLDVNGQIVAQGAPEPSHLAQTAVGLTLLVALARRRSRA